MRRSHWILCAAIPIAVASAIALQHHRHTSALTRRVDDALERGFAHLLAAQDPDGAFRSRVYGTLKDGPTLTPLALKALAYRGTPQTIAAARRAARYLAGLARDDWVLDVREIGLMQPVYSAALTVMGIAKLRALSPTDHDDDALFHARFVWYTTLIHYQVSERGGYSPTEAAYGGFAYDVAMPKKPAVPTANLSSTLVAVGAMRAHGIFVDQPPVKNALLFVKRCQNVPDEDSPQAAVSADDPDDGGFFASPVDPALNKAGLVEGSATRFRSYGSATADGLRALLACGEPADGRRARAARDWLVRSFDADHNPGRFPPDRAPLADGYYFYWTWSAAHALVRAGVTAVRGEGGRERPWAPELAEALLARQGEDGAWRNARTDGREDDPIVATALALGALANCRMMIAGD